MSRSNCFSIVQKPKNIGEKSQGSTVGGLSRRQALATDSDKNLSERFQWGPSNQYQHGL